MYTITFVASFSVIVAMSFHLGSCLGVFVAVEYGILSILTTYCLLVMGRKKGGITDIAYLCFVLLFVQSVLYPALTLYGCNFNKLYFHRVPDNLYAEALLLWIAVFLTFSLGLLAFRQRKRIVHVAIESLKRDHNPILVSSILIFISIVGSILFIAFRGGLEQLFDEGATADSIRIGRGLGIFNLLIFSSYPAVAYLGWHAFSGPRVNRKRLVTAIIFSVIASLPFVILGRRTALLLHLGLAISPAIIRYNFKLLRVAIPFLLLLLVFFDMFSAELRTHYYSTGIVDIDVAFEKASSESARPMTYNQLEWTAALMGKEESGEFSILYGKTFLAGALNWLPRTLFPHKPWTSGAYLSAILTGGYSMSDRKPSSGITSGIIVESLMNFGRIGCVVLMFVLGIVIAWVGKKVSLLVRNVYGGTIWSLVYFFVPLGLFADDFGGFINKLVSLSPSVVLLYLLHRRAVISRTVTINHAINKSPETKSERIVNSMVS